MATAMTLAIEKVVKYKVDGTTVDATPTSSLLDTLLGGDNVLVKADFQLVSDWRDAQKKAADYKKDTADVAEKAMTDEYAKVEAQKALEKN